MLEEINIQNLGVIETAQLEFTSGLNVITGETGAGKTMVLTALGLLLGKRSDYTIVRAGTDYTSVEGCWDLNGSPIIPTILETGAVLEDDRQLFINRTINKDGKSRMVLGGKTTPASVLVGLSESLVSIHGQADQIRLKTPAAQRQALDKYAGEALIPVMKEYREAYQEWKRLTELLKDIKSNLAAREREYEFLTQAVEDFNKIQPTAGEDETLKNEALTLTHVEVIKEVINTARVLLSNEDFSTEIPDTLTNLNSLVDALSTIAEYSSELKEISESAIAIQLEAQELSSTLNSYLEGIDSNALIRLEEIQERRAQISTLLRKYGLTLDEAIAFWEESEEKLIDLNPENNNVEKIETDLEAARKDMENKAGIVTELRRKTGKSLSTAVNKELVGLAMGGNKLVISIEDKGQYTTSGADTIAFLMSYSTGGEPKPLGKSASGGELSRIMLSIEVVLADMNPNMTYVFDEADSGIGGATGTDVGKKLATLSKKCQVIVVSHLAQVAVFADNHLKVNKYNDGNSFIASDITVLNDEEKIEEIARMLSGLNKSELGKDHAKELIDLGKAFKESLDG